MNTVLSNQSGLTEARFKGMRYSTTVIPCFSGEVYVASIYTKTDDANKIDNGAFLEINVYNANGERVQTEDSIVSIKPTVNNTWQEFSVTEVIPSGCTYVAIYAYVTRNGKLWFANPLLERKEQSLNSIKTELADKANNTDTTRTTTNKTVTGAINELNSKKLNVSSINLTTLTAETINNPNQGSVDLKKSTINPGTYIVIGSTNFDTNTKGTRKLVIILNDKEQNCVEVSPNPNGRTSLNVTETFTITSTAIIKLTAYQNSGVDLSCFSSKLVILKLM